MAAKLDGAITNARNWSRDRKLATLLRTGGIDVRYEQVRRWLIEDGDDLTREEFDAALARVQREDAAYNPGDNQNHERKLKMISGFGPRKRINVKEE